MSPIGKSVNNNAAEAFDRAAAGRDSGSCIRRWHVAGSAVARGCRRIGEDRRTGEDDVRRMLRALAGFVLVLDMLVGGVCARAVVSGSLCCESALAPGCPRACAAPEGSVWGR